MERIDALRYAAAEFDLGVALSVVSGGWQVVLFDSNDIVATAVLPTVDEAYSTTTEWLRDVYSLEATGIV